VAPDLLSAVALHLALEEAIVYPALLDIDEIEDEIRESIVEHLGAKRLIRDLVDAPVADDTWWASMRVLRRQVEEHMEREEEDVLPVMRERLDEAQRAALMHEMEAFIVETLASSADAPLEAALSNTEARLE
jgi:iron-sulfur cluster repair protein YtfE (RIC family)